MEDVTGISARRENTRSRLLSAALEVFSQEGFAGASIEMIAEAAGFTRGAFYSNFSSKEELFLELIKQQIQLRIDAATEALRHLDRGLFIADTIDSVAVGDLLGSFFADPEEERRWHIVHAEFELFALRNPDQGRRYVDLSDAYEEQVARLLVPLLESAGLQFLGDPMVNSRIIVMGYLEASHRAFLIPDLPFDEALSQQMDWFTTLASRFIVPIGHDGQGFCR